jgi:hypothetical protein
MKTERISKVAPLLIVFGTVVFFLTVWGLARFYLGQFSLPAQMVYGESLPAHLKQLASFRVPEGLTADLYNTTDYTKVGFAFTFKKPTETEPVTGQDLLRILSDSEATNLTSSGLTEFTSRYLTAQFDARRAYDVAPVAITLPDRVIQAARFNSKGEWNHLVGLVNMPHGQFVFQAVRKNSEVDPKTVADIIVHELEASKTWTPQ